MDNPPQEIINRIGGHLVVDDDAPPSHLYTSLAPLATLSLAWQEAIESITFRKLKIKSDELYTLQYLVTGRRRHHLADLVFEVVLPTRKGIQVLRQELDIGKQANDACFTQAVRDLFKILKCWENDNVQRPMRLVLGETFSAVDARLGMHDFLISGRMDDSYIILNDPDSLPTLSRVRELKFKHPYGYPDTVLVSPRVAPWLCKLLPNVNKTLWSLEEFDDESEIVAFAEAIKATQLQPRSKLIMDLHVFGKNAVLPVNPASLPYDLISAAIREVSQNLTILTLDFPFDATLFWPSTSETPGTPYWPHLKQLKMSSQNFRIPSQASDDKDFNGDQIIRITEQPLASALVAFGKAVKNMRSLEYFYFEDYSRQVPGTGRFVILYHCPGPWTELGFIQETKTAPTFRRIYYACEGRYNCRPEEEVVVALRKAGKEKFGGRLIEETRRIDTMT